MFRVLFCWILIIHCLQDSYSEPLSPRSTIHDTEPLSRSQNNINITDKCKCGKIESPKIVNGSLAKSHAYPWMVAIFFENSPFVNCGGSLINDRYILTAGHCVDGINKDDVQVRLGTNDAYQTDNERIKIKRILIFPNYISIKENTRDISLNDIALLELEEPTDQLPNVGPVCLPLDKEENDYADYEAKVTGWGVESIKQENDTTIDVVPNILLATTVTVLSNESCARIWEMEMLPKELLCALGNGSGVCNGDSGGPLIVGRSGRYEQIGIASSAQIKCMTNRPGFYVRVSEYVEWIIAETQNAVYCN